MHRFANATAVLENLSNFGAWASCMEVILCMLKVSLAYTQENIVCFSIPYTAYRAPPPMFWYDTTAAFLTETQ